MTCEANVADFVAFAVQAVVMDAATHVETVGAERMDAVGDVVVNVADCVVVVVDAVRNDPPPVFPEGNLEAPDVAPMACAMEGLSAWFR